MIADGMSRRVRLLLGLAAAVLALAVLGASPQLPPVTLGPGRVVVAPVNLAVRAVPEVEPGIEPVWRELLEYLAARHERVVALEPAGAVQLWNEVMADSTAQGDVSALYDAYSRFARRVAEQGQFDDIVFPSLVARLARVNGHVASWDGVREIVEVPGQLSESIDTLREGRIVLTRSGGSGEIAAASLHVAVFSADGALRFERTGGLVVVQKLVEPQDEHHLELQLVPRRDAFADPAPLRAGIAATFER
jgi:hypothetical protein